MGYMYAEELAISCASFGPVTVVQGADNQPFPVDGDTVENPSNMTDPILHKNPSSAQTSSSLLFLSFLYNYEAAVEFQDSFPVFEVYLTPLTQYIPVPIWRRSAGISDAEAVPHGRRRPAYTNVDSLENCCLSS